MPKPLNILILEDNPADAELLLNKLRRVGFEPAWQIVDNEKDFTAHIKPELDVIISDYSLPQFTGLQALILKNESEYDIPFIIVSGAIGEDLAVECMRAGADDYLFKDRLGRLGAAVDNAVKKKDLRDEKMQSEEALQQSEEKFRLLAENSIDCIWMLDTKLRFTYLSPSLERILGFKQEQMVGTKLSSHFKKKEFLKVGAVAAKAITNYKTFTNVTFETKMLNSKNDEVDIEISSKVLLNSQGKLIGLQGTTKNITERKQAEQEIEMLLDLSRQASAETSLDDLLFFIAGQIVDVIPSAETSSIFFYDGERKVIKVQAWAGFKDSEIKGLEFSTDGNLAGKIFQSKKPTLINDVSEDPNFELIDKHSLSKVKTQIAVPLNVKKRVVGIIFADNLSRTNAFSQKDLDLLESIGNQLAGVIENARLLENVRHSKEQYHSVVDDSPALINRFLPDGTITFVNQAYSKFFGKTNKELIGTNIQSVIPEEGRESVISYIASITEELPVRTIENKVIRHDGEVRWMRWIDRALFDDKGQKISIQSFGEDITASKQADEKEQRHFKNIAFLTETAMQFVDFPPQEDIYRYVGERLRELAGESIVAVNSIDQAKGILTTRAVVGMGKYAKDIMKLIGRNPEGIEYDATGKSLAYLIDGELHDYKEGLYGIFLRTVPKPACRTIEKLFRLNKIYSIGFVQHKRSFGNAAIFLPQGIELERVETIKLFVKQASIAIQRRQAEQAMKQEQEKAQKYLDIAEVMIVALNSEGEITLVNQKGASILGYQIEELIGKNWFNICIPKADKKRAKKGFDEFIADGAILRDHFEQIILTESGEERIIDWHSIPLWEWVDEEKCRIGSLSSGEDITRRKRVEHLLNTLNQASVSMGTDLTHEDIFTAIEKELKQLGFSCILFAIDQTHSNLFPQYMSSDYAASLKMAGKLGGIKREDFLMPIDSVDEYKMVVREKKTLFIENSDEIIRQTLPKFAKKLSSQIIKIMSIPKNIPAPLIVEDQVIGVFSVYSNDLTKDDIPTITAFAHQLAGAWNKVKLIQDLRTTMDGTIHTIAATVEARDPYTAGHQTHVADLAAAIATEMHLSKDQVEGIRMAGIIHDLGKINIPAEILSKPGKLSEIEFKIIQTHPQVGFDLLKEIEFPWPIAQMVHQHHEKMDGSGYPQGLKGDEILLEARILAVADIVEAMSSHRPYRPAHGIEKALDQIRQDRGTLLDPKVVDACLKVFEQGYKLPKE